MPRLCKEGRRAASGLQLQHIHEIVQEGHLAARAADLPSMARPALFGICQVVEGKLREVRGPEDGPHIASGSGCNDVLQQAEGKD